MNSNFIFKQIGYFFFLVTLVSCGLKIGEKKTQNDTAQIKGVQCLNQSISDLKLFLEAEASDDQLSSALNCIQDVFIAFKENIRGESKNAYTPQEVAQFIKINFFKDDQIEFSNDFLNQIMKFKAALIGGDDQVITKNEIDLLVNFVTQIKPEVMRLNPYMDIIVSKWHSRHYLLDESTKEQKFLEAKNQFIRLIRKICSEFASSQRFYKIDDLFSFVEEILKLTKSNPENLNTIQKAKPFFKKFKYYLIGGNDSIVGPDWEKLGQTMHEAFFQSLRIKYFIKSIDPADIKSKWRIYEKIATDLTNLIENLLKTKDSQSLTNKEIFELLQPLSQILPEVGLSEEILDELGDLKVMLLGESSLGRRGWSQKDFEILRLKIPIIFESLSVLIETIDILKLNKEISFKPSVTYPNFIKAEVKILSAVHNLSLLVEKSYDLNSLKNLFLHLAEGPFKNLYKIPNNFDGLYKTLISAKFLLTGEPGSLLNKWQIRNLLNIAMRAYLHFNEYDIFASGFKLESLNFIIAVERLWPKIKSTVIQELNFKPNHFISTSEFTQFVMTLQQQKFLKTKIRPESWASVFNALWSNILVKPEDRLSSIFRKGFDIYGLHQISTDIQYWLHLQRNINEIFSQSDVWSKNELLSELNFRIQNEKNELVKEILNSQRFIINQDIAMTFNQFGFLRIFAIPSGLFHQEDLFKSILGQLFSRIVIRSYANEIERIQLLKGVLKEEVQTAFNQFKPLAVDLDLIESSNNSFINSRFIESNLFLSVSDGDKWASFLELHHILLHIFSGISRAEEIKKDIVKNCLPPQIKETSGQIAVWEECVLDQYQINEKAFQDLPEFLNLRKQFQPKILRDYYFNLLKAAGHIPNNKKTVLFSDAALFPHVLQYIEMVYLRYDINQDQFLQKDEALLAYPIFKDLLKDLVKSYKQIKEDDLPGVFVYILKYGRPPRKESIPEILKFISFIRDKEQKDWNINSSRLDLGKIFNFIAESISSTN